MWAERTRRKEKDENVRRGDTAVGLALAKFGVLSITIISRYTLYTLLESRSWTARCGISVSTLSLGSRVSRPGSDRAF